jgi:hypothetical protein
MLPPRPFSKHLCVVLFQTYFRHARKAAAQPDSQKGVLLLYSGNASNWLCTIHERYVMFQAACAVDSLSPRRHRTGMVCMAATEDPDDITKPLTTTRRQTPDLGLDRQSSVSSPPPSSPEPAAGPPAASQWLHAATEASPTNDDEAASKSDDLTEPSKTGKEPPDTSLNSGQTVLSSPRLTVGETLSAPMETGAFITAYEESAAKSRESLSAVRRKLAAPVLRVLYQDLENAIWTAWHVRPADLTVGHVGHALDLLRRGSEGGVELDRVTCEAAGIDYAGLILRMGRSRVPADEMSAAPAVPRKSWPPATSGPEAGEGAPARAGTSDPEPGRENTMGTGSALLRKRGRPAEIGVAQKESARTAREQGKSWKEVAKILYATLQPTFQQAKNAANVLNHYTKVRVAPPDNS